jgi:hypothetical protein
VELRRLATGAQGGIEDGQLPRLTEYPLQLVSRNVERLEAEHRGLREPTGGKERKLTAVSSRIDDGLEVVPERDSFMLDRSRNAV